MSILNQIVKLAFKPRIKHIHRYMQQPRSIQEKWLERLIHKAKNTEWGKQFHFDRIKSIKDFQKAVPLNDYESLKPFIQRMMHGEKDVLWKGQVKWFSKSSGTTNDKSKYIPVTHENLHKCHLKGSHDALTMWCNSKPNTKIMHLSKGLIMGGCLDQFEPFPETTIGDISAIMLHHMPFYGKYFYTPTMEVALMDDWEKKIELMAEMVSKENVTNIGGVPTWTIVLFRKILEITGKSNMLEVFPNFEIYYHGGVSFLPYRAQFEEFFPGDQVQYRENYNASEGFFSSQYDASTDDMLLLLDNGVFYEFIPMDEFKNENPSVLAIHEVELNVNYALVISTNAGLWRYVIGDTVKFTSLYPHRIKITGRTKHFINVFGEEVMVENADKALKMTTDICGGRVHEYTVGPIHLSQGKGGHEWTIEFDQPPADLERFRDFLDQHLQELNSDYEAKRFKDLALQKLVLHSLPKGSFYSWLKARGKYGGQNKVPRLSNSREHIESLLNFAQQQRKSSK